MRQAISPGERLAVTLRFLATGESFSSLQYQFRISAASLSIFVPEVCQAVSQVLKDDYFKCPSTPEQWLQIAQLFHDRWQLPHCIGAADGKHVRILHPRNSGSEFYNYKGFFSVVLLAVVDADYKFIFADVGCQGRISDDYFKCPSTPEQWLQIAQLFHDRWQLPHCIGAADGKHVRILHPRNSGSLRGEKDL